MELSSEMGQVRVKNDQVGEYVRVSSTTLEKLVKDIIQLKQSLSKVLAVNGMSLLHKKTYTLEQEVLRLKTELDKKLNETEYLKNKLNELLQEAEVYREENFQFKNTISVMNEERSEEYGDILSFVSICLTLLWRLSLSDACVSTMLTRKSIEKFLEYISRSLDSFLETSKEDSQLDSSSDEFALVLSIGGIITNIAATALGREFLVTKESGIKVIDALILYLSEMPPQHGVEIKNLILKAMYNTSINSKGLKYLSSKKGLMTTLGMLLKEETDTELRLSLVRCIQSLVIEPESASLAHEIMEVIPVRKFQEYADLSKGELKKTTLELISDLTVFLQSQPIPNVTVFFSGVQEIIRPGNLDVFLHK